MAGNEVGNTAPALPTDNRRKELRQYPVLSLKDVLRRIQDNCGEIEMKQYGSGRNYVVILPKAWDELKTMIDWGKRTPANVYEQLYQGMGYYFNNINDGKILVVSHFLYIYAANRSPASACIFDGVYDSIMQRIEYEREIYRKNEASYNITPEGNVYNPFVDEFGSSTANLYGHTHPDLGVFFSHADRTSGFATPDMPAAIFVADPIRMQMKAAVGIEQDEAQVIACSYCPIRKEEQEKTKYLTELRLEKAVFSGSRYENRLTSKLYRICVKLLNSEYCLRGCCVIKPTWMGKEHIKVDIIIGQEVHSWRRVKETIAAAGRAALSGRKLWRGAEIRSNVYRLAKKGMRGCISKSFGIREDQSR